MKWNILIVDDESANRAVLSAILKAEGYDIGTAENGEAALIKLKKEIFNLVILDVMMPGMSGFEVLKKIRENNVWRTIPVIVMTALNDKENRMKGLELGADDFTSKPYDVDEILVRIKSQLNLSYLRNQLSEKRKMLRIIDNIDEGIVVSDNKFMPVNMNVKAKEILGVAEAPENILDYLNKKFNKKFLSSQNDGNTIITVQGEKTLKYYSISIQKIVDASESIDSYIFIIRDVSTVAALLSDKRNIWV